MTFMFLNTVVVVVGVWLVLGLRTGSVGNRFSVQHCHPDVPVRHVLRGFDAVRRADPQCHRVDPDDLLGLVPGRVS